MKHNGDPSQQIDTAESMHVPFDKLFLEDSEKGKRVDLIQKTATEIERTWGLVLSEWCE